MYWRQSIPLFGGLKYNKNSTGKEYLSYRKNGVYIREPISDIKKDIKGIFHPGQRTLDVNEVQKKIKDSFNTYNDGEIFREDNGQYNKVSSGTCRVENKQVIISANVTKTFEIKDIAIVEGK